MRFGIPLNEETAPSEAITYVVSIIRKRYPNAIVVNEDQCPLPPRSIINQSKVHVCLDRDAYTSARLFSIPLNNIRSAIAVSYDDGNLFLEPNPDTIELASSLAQLPLWRHKSIYQKGMTE